jgi:hypothetical protein
VSNQVARVKEAGIPEDTSSVAQSPIEPDLLPAPTSSKAKSAFNLVILGGNVFVVVYEAFFDPRSQARYHALCKSTD